MFNCERCMHEEGCDIPSRQMRATMAKEDECSDFKDKTQFVEVVRCLECVH